MKQAVLYLRVSTIDQTTANQERESELHALKVDLLTLAAGPSISRLASELRDIEKSYQRDKACDPNDPCQVAVKRAR